MVTAAEPGSKFVARVDFIDPVVQQANRTIMVKGLAPNPGRILKPGMFVEARLSSATRENAVVIPEDAVQPLRTANVVWVVDKRAGAGLRLPAHFLAIIPLSTTFPVRLIAR